MSSRLWWTAFSAVCALLCLPIVLNAYIPIIDLANHIARLHIATGSSPALAEFYDFTLVVTMRGNSALDLLWLGIGQHVMSVHVFVKFMLCFYIVGFIFSICLLHRIIWGSWSYWPLLSGLLVYNDIFFWGFLGYMVSSVFIVLAFILWIAKWQDSPRRKALLFLPIVLILSQLHLLAVVGFGLMAAGYELERLYHASDRKAHFRSNIVLASPFVLFLLFLAFELWSAGPSEFDTSSKYGDLSQRLLTVLSTFVGNSIPRAETYDSLVMVTTSWMLTIGSLAAMVMIVLLVLRSLKASEGPKMPFARNFLGPIVALFTFSLLVPPLLEGVALTHIRFPFIAFGILLAASAPTHLTRASFHGILALAVLVTVFRVIGTFAYFHDYSKTTGDLLKVTEQLDPQDRLIHVRESEAMAMFHIHALLVSERQVFVPTLFQGTHGLRVKDPWRYIASEASGSVKDEKFRPTIVTQYLAQENPRNYYWCDWDQNFTHLLVSGNPEPETFENAQIKLLAQVGTFRLYETLSPRIKAEMPSSYCASQFADLPKLELKCDYPMLRWIWEGFCLI